MPIFTGILFSCGFGFIPRAILQISSDFQEPRQIMSLGYPYYRPTTPPPVRLGDLIGMGHNCTTPDSSGYSNESSPWSVTTSTTSPSTTSPRYHHGSVLLPKIRPQDIVIEPASAGGPLRRHRMLSNTRNPPGYFMPYPCSRPPVRRSILESVDCLNNLSPHVSMSPIFASSSASVLSSPVNVTPPSKRKTSGGHSRSVSAPVIDEAILRRYGYPTYRQFPKYIPQTQRSPVRTSNAYTGVLQQSTSSPSQGFQIHSPTQATAAIPASPCAYPQTPSAHLSTVSGAEQSKGMASSSTSLISYLTAPTQAINVIRNVSVIPTRGLHDYFWWDIRNLRSWNSFSLSTFDSINGLTKLLKTEIPSQLTPLAIVPSSGLSPESETALISLIRDIYAPRVNAALAVSQGSDHLQLYAAPEVRVSGNKNCGAPHFLANYASDTERTSSDQPRGRLVGVVKSFDRWNTGMRNEGPNRRVEYLNGLAHLQRCMREHSCRYGFIMTEIELVCVRAGCDEGDDVPYFGFLELSAPIPTNVSDTTASAAASYSFPTPSPTGYSPPYFPQEPRLEELESEEGLPIPMTASLALYFLLMLSKSVPLPSQPSGHLNVGGPGALTRQRILPEGKDKWIPQPQIGERRDAKRVRGWVWPQDPWHRREGGVHRGKVDRKRHK